MNSRRLISWITLAGVLALLVNALYWQAMIRHGPLRQTAATSANQGRVLANQDTIKNLLRQWESDHGHADHP